MTTSESLNITLETLQPERKAPAKQNRLCVCISDVHFTDGTAGTQSAEETAWEDFFNEIISTCRKNTIEELTLVVVGDVADMIRTAVWAQKGVYPWERTEPDNPEQANPKFHEALNEIMQGIVELHARKPQTGQKDEASQSHRHGSCGFFYHLQNLRSTLKHDGTETNVIVLLGNHDKEMLTDERVLRSFYEDCLGQPVAELSPEYRRWIGKMYFANENHFIDPKTVPWLPFYWGDEDLRLFLTHGQWRDSNNSLAVNQENDQLGWAVGDGWRTDIWQTLQYQPFTAACFGDSVAAGVLSTFIFQAKNQLAGRNEPEISRIKCILDELDLYRPSSAAVTRILQEARREETSAVVRDIIESELYQAICEWLSWDFTLESSPKKRRIMLKAARAWLKLTGPFRLFRIQLTLVKAILSLMGFIDKKLLPLTVYHKDGASFKDIQKFPTFQKAFWERGFRLHGEGHTHIPLQSDAGMEYAEPNSSRPRSNFTYVNFGTWRDQILGKENGGYRRRGVGRALFVLRRQQDEHRSFRYYVSDSIDWGDEMDQL
ncbi:hypothetical protein Q9L42_009550 [Methylomarinum sp. Ch1-1]|uniref:Calcineurin-like phosphoesterase domain-containing protein n=1 Tax=Methylomarinum roseum TaxID=3067653 RepID=A0AAU7NZG9_9GAMM|nr:hypothetical protein [Methylomarinum sp. Ch1-1]MDP4521518.1 hypothetical protein [Methylomarinum sp. Ch1-1]